MKRTVHYRRLLTAVMAVIFFTLHAHASADTAAGPFYGGGNTILCMEMSAGHAPFMIAMGDNVEKKKEIPASERRFIDNNDGTVTDTKTGLIWLKDANRFGKQTQDEAVALCKKLSEDGKFLKDGSKPGEWRLPNRDELMSLIHKEYYNPAISNDADTGKWEEGGDSSFLHVETDYYWVSDAGSNSGGYVYVGLAYGDVRYGYKTYLFYVWPVKGEIKGK